MIDWSSTAIVFPGQGSQEVGMGAELAKRFPSAAQVFQEADQVLGFEFSKLLFDGPAEMLDDTMNTQPALYVSGIATLRALESQFGEIKPIAAAGHSVGEFTALAASGAVSFAEGLKLVRERGRLMKEAGQQNPGAMAALLGLSIEDTREICEKASTESGKPIVIANDNCPGQVVISGDAQAMDKALALATEKGAKRAIKLAVSVAAHSPLMASAADTFRQKLSQTPFTAPRFPIIGNVSAMPLRTADDIRAELDRQLTLSVRWTESVKELIELGAKTFLELGPKDVLTGLLRRIDRSANGVAVNSADALVGLGS